jgi:glycogen phosphorylase
MSDVAERALHTRIARSAEAIRRSFIDNLFYVCGRDLDEATALDHYIALAHTVRDRLLARFVVSGQHNHREPAVKTVAYLSAEYLPGPWLGNNLLVLELWENTRLAMEQLGLDLVAILETEEEPGLGNGGLGRLAACYLDSMATLEIPAIGYGLRYEYGIFDQRIQDGWQVETADAWLRNGNPWELPRQHRYLVKFGGRVEHMRDDAGHLRVHWLPETTLQGIAYDTMVPGHGVLNVNRLRLWKSEARESFDLHAFNVGDYYGAVEDMVVAQNLTKVLYPNDEPTAGKALRLRQQYFFVACSLQDMIRLTLRDMGSLERFPERFVVQLNDTHPAIAIAEFMRLLVDEHGMGWDMAWALTRRSFAYTNHTLLPEALEAWPVQLFERVLPRHLEIIYDINARFLDEVRIRFLGDDARLSRLSLIDEGTGDGVRRVRMAHLACVGSMSINGVAELHSDLLKTTVLRDFHELWPERFQNKTNGVTPRRFIGLANRPLATLLDEVVGVGWLRGLERLGALEPHAEDSAFRQRWREVKRQGKQRLAEQVGRSVDGSRALDPDSLFDVQAKRIHEYKRQHLNLLHIVHLYQRLKQQPNAEVTPRTFVFAGKAAPGYRMAKLIIRLIHGVAEVIDRDARVRDVLRVVFVPNFSVKSGQCIYPGADLSEQISTAGKEASGTGNMKFMMNGALTIGTLDGANIEIRRAVGAENFFLFGLSAEQIERTCRMGYRTSDVVAANEDLRLALELVVSGLFSHGDRELFRPLADQLLEHDPFLVCADFQDYVAAQARVAAAWREREQWTRMSILNVARSGPFSSDRAVSEYDRDIWRTRTPVPRVQTG